MSVGSATDGLHRLDDAEQRQLRRIVKQHGLAGAARLLDLSRGVVASAAGGLGVRRGSLELVREALKAQASAQANGEK